MPANRLSMRKNKGSLTPEMGESVKRSQDCEKLSYFTTCGGQLCGTRHVGGLIVALAGSVDGRRVGAVAVSGTPQGGGARPSDSGLVCDASELAEKKRHTLLAVAGIPRQSAGVSHCTGSGLSDKEDQDFFGSGCGTCTTNIVSLLKGR